MHSSKIKHVTLIIYRLMISLLPCHRCLLTSIAKAFKVWR
ncbi:hypothetical protein MGSAQ_003375 [marine sediment metagenome]|uniref:Uncharacterized protein n=1 Tax=marine sediment metagenome TaxID=412755 RepID=A0A1B6NP33_9ZZZZ